jgi:hypothetical protein
VSLISRLSVLIVTRNRTRASRSKSALRVVRVHRYVLGTVGLQHDARRWRTGAASITAPAVAIACSGEKTLELTPRVCALRAAFFRLMRSASCRSPSRQNFIGTCWALRLSQPIRAKPCLATVAAIAPVPEYGALSDTQVPN